MLRPMFEATSKRGAAAAGSIGGAGDEKVASVTELTRRIKGLLETSIAPGWVRGEVSNLRVQSSGHSYFSLKDAGAQIACVMFRGDAARTGSGGLLRDGVQVLAFGSLGVYEPRGNYQLIVRVVVDDGAGRLQQEFERLKRRLAAEGLFDPARKRPLPAVPRTVGFVTSPTGAAVQDFVRILKRRQWKGRLVVLPVKVQGAEAAGEMVRALEVAADMRNDAVDTRASDEAVEDERLFDLIVIGRGGGSLEDLWAFNEEALVRAVAASPVPIVSAVGHEIDFTLCDFAADVRAETPSAAAELITSGYLEYVSRVRRVGADLDASTERALADERAGLRLLAARLAAVSPWARVEKAWLQLDDMQSRLERAIRGAISRGRDDLGELRARLVRFEPGNRIERARDRVASIEARLQGSVARACERKAQQVATLGERLRALDPAAVLARGYVIMRDAAGRPLVQRAGLERDQRVRAQFHDGEAELRVVDPLRPAEGTPST
jgi:exodeoxyribonuclease VII large subunit